MVETVIITMRSDKLTQDAAKKIAADLKVVDKLYSYDNIPTQKPKKSFLMKQKVVSPKVIYIVDMNVDTGLLRSSSDVSYDYDVLRLGQIIKNEIEAAALAQKLADAGLLNSLQTVYYIVSDACISKGINDAASAFVDCLHQKHKKDITAYTVHSPYNRWSFIQPPSENNSNWQIYGIKDDTPVIETVENADAIGLSHLTNFPEKELLFDGDTIKFNEWMQSDTHYRQVKHTTERQKRLNII